MTPQRMTPQQLAERSKQLGLTQERLAQALGVSHSTVARWLNGSRRIPGYLALALNDLARNRPADGQGE
jgi:transcriptional regulator with XRE-family HTH domain